MWSPVFWKEWPVYLFSQGATISVYQLSAKWQTRWCEQSSAKIWSRVFVCASQPSPTTKSWDMSCFLTHATPRLTPPACFSYPPQPSQSSWRESIPGVCRDLSAPKGGFFKQNTQQSGCWIGGNQALVVRPREWNVSGFANLQGVRGRLHDSVKPSHKNLTYTNWETVSIPSKGVFIVAEMFMNCTYFWAMCCKYLLIVLPFSPNSCVYEL